MLLQELLREAETRGVGDDLRHALAACHLGLPLRGRHHRWPLVAVGVIIADHSDEEPVAKLGGPTEVVLVANVAEVVDAVAIDVPADAEQRHVQVLPKIREDRNVVEGDKAEHGELEVRHHGRGGREGEQGVQPAARRTRREQVRSHRGQEEAVSEDVRLAAQGVLQDQHTQGPAEPTQEQDREQHPLRLLALPSRGEGDIKQHEAEDREVVEVVGAHDHGGKASA
mmetsp:Transcript_65015/g.209437  ORF Transcript_65015/g.209437 Transcript_65015/m.209437 type:complete len:226 (-) Transcript_65015:641-1318(-)